KIILTDFCRTYFTLKQIDSIFSGAGFTRDESVNNVNDIYRVDLIAFWKNKRFAIFIDDISHFARLEKNNLKE
ncbi:MAG: hypothetical protein ACKN9K_02025, partial [Dolichospermum sp.]